MITSILQLSVSIHQLDYLQRHNVSWNGGLAVNKTHKAFADSNFWSLSLAKTLAHVDTSKTFAIRPQGIAPLDVQVSSHLLLPMDQDLEV